MIGTDITYYFETSFSHILCRKNLVFQYSKLQGSTDAAENLISDGAKYGIEIKDFNKASQSKASVITFKNVAVTDTGDYTCKWDTTTFDPKATMTVAVRCKSKGWYSARYNCGAVRGYIR